MENTPFPDQFGMKEKSCTNATRKKTCKAKALEKVFKTLSLREYLSNEIYSILRK